MSRNIKQLKKIPNHLKEFVVTELETHLVKYFAKPDPKLLESLANLLERPLEELILNAKEDNDDYNKNAISRLVDKAVGVFMQAGQKNAKNGDIIRVAKDQDFLLKPLKVRNLELTRDEYLVNSDSYSDFPFDFSIWSEIRGKFLLQTEKTDSFSEMMKILDLEMPKFVSIIEWEKIKKAIKKAESRIFKESLNFPDPVEDEGNAQEISEADYTRLGISKHDIFTKDENGEIVKKDFSEVRIDYRNDNHDLVAMKELVLILLKKKKMEYFSIAPGFFAKYLPELKEAGVDGLIFKVSNEELVEIKIWKSAGHDNKDGETVSPYSPISATCALLHSYAIKYDKIELDETGTNYFYEINSVDDSFLNDSDRYYVVVDGCVSSPEWGQINAPLSYESYALNKIQIPAGEVFLFEKRTEFPLATRLYFTPYKPMQLHPLHQLGSVIFGSNDQVYHSTSKRELFDAKSLDLNILSDRFVETEGKTNDERYSPAVAAFQIFFCKDAKMGTNLLNMILPENRKYVTGLFGSLYEITPFTIDLECEYLCNVSDLYCDDNVVTMIKKILENYAPFTKRFLYKEYIKFNRATEKIQLTFFNELAEKIKTADLMAQVQDQDISKKIEEMAKDPSLNKTAFDAKLKQLLDDSKKQHLKNLGKKNKD